MSSTCYTFSPLLLFHRFSQVVTNFAFTSKTYAMLLLLAAKKLLAKNVEDKLNWVFFDGIRGVVQLRHFVLFSVPISQQFPRPTSLYLFCFLEWPLKLDCTFPWQLTGAFEQLTCSESWKLSSCKQKVTNIFRAILTLIIYPFIFIVSIECMDSSVSTGKNTYCTTFKLCGWSRSG